MKTPSVGSLVRDVDQILQRLRGRLDLIVKRTERGPEGVCFMVLVEDLDGQERTIWCWEFGFDRSFNKRVLLANQEQERIAVEVWTLCNPGETATRAGGVA